MKISKIFWKPTSFLIVFGLLFPFMPAQAEESVVRNITFPVIGTVTYGNDFGFERSDGRKHEGVDIMGKKLQLLVSTVDGIITEVIYPEASWGFSVSIKDSEGYEYNYLHINNDTPGTDDGQDQAVHGYALDVQEGSPVVKGQLLGYMGDSGNAEATSPHLHFEIRGPNSNVPINPYPSLKAAKKITTPVTVYPKSPNEILPYDTFSGGANIAVGSFDADPGTEIVTGARSGGGPLVKVLKPDGIELSSFYAYDKNFRGGIDVATGDIDGDGIDEIITAPGPGGGPHIRIFKSSGVEVSNFFAYTQSFRGGVSVGALDIDGDKKAEIITAPLSKGGPHIKISDSIGIVKKEFFAYASSFQGGVDIAGVIDPATNQPRVITAPGKGGGAHIKVLAIDGALVQEFFAYDATFNGGTRISAGVLGQSTTPYIFTIPWTGGSPHLKTFSLGGVFNKDAFAGFEPWARGGYDVAVRQGKAYLISGPGRRVSVRIFDFENQNNRNRNFNRQMGIGTN